MFYAFDGEHTSMSLGAELEQALLSAPWQLKSDPNNHLWLIKYAPHPSKPGYVFLATDLDRVLYEALTSPAILYRLEEVREALGLSNGAEEGDIKSQTESALSSLGHLFGGAWDKTKLEVKKHDYHDAIFELRHSTFSWQFFTSEIKGRQPLHMLAKHLVVPLIGLSHPSAIRNPLAGVQDVLAILESTDILKELSAGTSQAKAEPSTSRSPVPSTSRSKEEEELVPSSSPVPEEPAGEDEGDEGDEEEYRSPSATPTPTPQPALHATASKTPRSARKTAKSPEDGADGDDSPPPRKLGVGKRRQPSPDASDRRATSTASASVPPSKAAKAPSAVQKKRESPAESSTSPIPEPPRPSQKAKREKEKEEEEALEKRREEMKRKMARGGGGRLGARRGRL